MRPPSLTTIYTTSAHASNGYGSVEPALLLTLTHQPRNRCMFRPLSPPPAPRGAGTAPQARSPSVRVRDEGNWEVWEPHMRPASGCMKLCQLYYAHQIKSELLRDACMS